MVSTADTMSAAQKAEAVEVLVGRLVGEASVAAIELFMRQVTYSLKG